MLVATTISNASNFFFQLIIGRMLGPAEYSVLTALLSLFVILSVPTATVQTVISKYSSTFMAKKHINKISYLFFRSFKKLSIFASIIFIIFFFIASPLAQFLKIDSLAPIIVLGSMVAVSIVTPVGRGVLQGMQQFNQLGANLIVDAITRLSFGVLFVFLGYKASGAIAASTIAGVVAIAIVFRPLKYLFGNKGKPIDFDSSEIYKYFWPVLVTLFCFNLLTNIDIVFVKHFFSAKDAGLYSAASLLGKIVLFFPGAFAMVMFSKTSELHAKNSSSVHVLKKTLLVVLLSSIGITAFYFLFPTFIISMVFGESFVGASHLLGLFGIAMTIFSVINIGLLYLLSINNLRFILPLVVNTTILIALLWFIPLNPNQVIYVLIGTGALLLLTIMIRQKMK